MDWTMMLTISTAHIGPVTAHMLDGDGEILPELPTYEW